MKMREWTTVDKTAWGPGPWQEEPDKVQWLDAETGLACLAKRNGVGAWCGYVGVPEGHPAYKRRHYGDLWNVECHGGLIYSDFCQEGPEAETICHVAEPGEPEPLWWFGFDCSHSWDAWPYKGRTREDEGRSYKTLGYVKREVAKLAQQLLAWKPREKGEKKRK